MKCSYRQHGWTNTPLRIISWLALSYWFGLVVTERWLTTMYLRHPTFGQGLAAALTMLVLSLGIGLCALAAFCFSCPIVPGTYIKGDHITRSTGFRVRTINRKTGEEMPSGGW